MIKILFVCHGNICRSPMAEFILKDIADKSGLTARFHIASAATSFEEIGNPVYPPARRKLKEHGIDSGGKRAVSVTKADYDKYDYLICMDRNNVRNLMRIIGSDPDRKVSMMLDYTDRPGDVADPWYTGNFDITYRDILEGCQGFMEFLHRQGEI